MVLIVMGKIGEGVSSVACGIVRFVVHRHQILNI
jgi:hypothetical protein